MNETMKKIMKSLEKMTLEQQRDELFRLEHKNKVNCVICLEVLNNGKIKTYEIAEQPWVEYDMWNDINDEVKKLKKSGIDITNSKVILLYSCSVTEDFDYYLDLIDYYIIEKNIDEDYTLEDIEEDIEEDELPDKYL